MGAVHDRPVVPGSPGPDVPLPRRAPIPAWCWVAMVGLAAGSEARVGVPRDLRRWDAGHRLRRRQSLPAVDVRARPWLWHVAGLAAQESGARIRRDRLPRPVAAVGSHRPRHLRVPLRGRAAVRLPHARVVPRGAPGPRNGAARPVRSASLRRGPLSAHAAVGFQGSTVHGGRSGSGKSWFARLCGSIGGRGAAGHRLDRLRDRRTRLRRDSGDAAADGGRDAGSCPRDIDRHVPRAVCDGTPEWVAVDLPGSPSHVG